MKKFKKTKRILSTVIIILILVSATIAIIYYGRGYRLDLQQKTLSTKGLLVANSQPNGAQIIINGKLTSATNATVNLAPDWYTVRLEKEGYSAWEKKFRIQGEVVAKTDAILFPINPSLSPITVTGVSNPLLSPDSTKILFTVSKNNSNVQETLDGSGVYILDLNDRPLGATRNARQIAKDYPYSFLESEFYWDPTSKKILSKVGNRYFLLDATLLNTVPQDVTTLLPTLTEEWQTSLQTLETERLHSLKTDLSQLFSASAKIISWSPDETKILYEATSSGTIPQIIEPALIGTNPTTEERSIKPDQMYVYDIKEDKNYFITNKNDLVKKQTTPTPTALPKNTKMPVPTPTPTPFPFTANNASFPIQWFPTSSHLLQTEEGKISIMDYDGTNKVTLYAGPFIGGLVAPWPNGSKIIILTTLNPQPDAQSNLYAINIR